jgi:nucleotide-binding universal stress UspA family protein
MKPSLAAVPGLFAIQKATGAQLQLFHVSADHAQDVDETQEFDSVRRLLGTDVGAKYAALHGANIAQAVVNEAERYHADLLVLGVKRASAFIAHVAPKTTFRIIAASPCAVLTVSS